MFEDLTNSKTFSVKRLDSLLKLHEHGSLIKAANGNASEQSRMSHDIRELSEFFGIELTTRAGKSIKLTAAGKQLVQITRDQFRQMKTFKDSLSKSKADIRIAANDSVSEWLLLPALGRLPPGLNIVVNVLSRPTQDLVAMLTARDVDLGLVRSDAIKAPLKQIVICEQRYALFLPRRIATAGMTLKQTLLECPNAAFASHSALLDKLGELCMALGGRYEPSVYCESIGQCIAAVRTQAFAAVLPVQCATHFRDIEYTVLGEEALTSLVRKIALAWHPRTLDVFGRPFDEFRRKIATTLKDVAEASAAC
jgi:DNA-binding transcriptional LysR family regulator